MKTMITGATGQLGRLIIDNLLQKMPQEQIVAGARHPDKAIELQRQGIEIRYADYDVPEGLEAAFHDISQLLLISSSHTDDGIRLAQHKRVIEAAVKAGVSHILYTGFAFPQQRINIASGNVHTLTERVILDSGLEYTFLRNALYIDFVNVLGLKEASRRGELITHPGIFGSTPFHVKIWPWLQPLFLPAPGTAIGFMSWLHHIRGASMISQQR